MKSNNKLLIYFLCLCVTAMVFVGCTQEKNGEQTEDELAVSGAWAIYPLMVRWAEEYQSLHPDVQIDISAGGAGKGMVDVLSGMVDIGMVSREIRLEEEEQGAYWIGVAKDAVFPTINANNPVLTTLFETGVSRDILVDLYIQGDVMTWGEIVGQPEITDVVNLYTRSDACGAAEIWAKYLGGTQEDLVGIGVFSDPGIIDAVIKDPFGIGYNNLNYAFDPNTLLPVGGSAILPIDIDENGQLNDQEIIDTKEKAIWAVMEGYYPSPPARVLYLVTNGQPIGLLRDFLTWILNDGQAYLSEAGYISLNEEQLSIEKEKLP
ncbi:MAG: substrate-binding domain-containing protein [Anaerolineales bacterium]|jgi:phosphate transport system substrate-binding protein